MAVKKIVSNDLLSTFVDSINVFDYRLSGVLLCSCNSTKWLVSCRLRN